MGLSFSDSPNSYKYSGAKSAPFFHSRVKEFDLKCLNILPILMAQQKA